MYICLRRGSRDKLFPHTPTLWTPNHYGRFLQEKKVPPWYNNSQEQTLREHCWRVKFSLEPYRELSVKQRRDNVQYDTQLSHSSGTDAHHYDTVSNRYSPSHFTKDILSNIS